MARSLLRYLESRGRLAPVSQLVAAGFSRREIAREAESGAIVRICNGWVASHSAERDAVVAIITGGKLTSTSALSSRGVWDGCDSRVHVAIPPNTSRRSRVLRTPLSQFQLHQFPRAGLVRHWVDERSPDKREPAWRVSVIDSLVTASKHLPGDQFVACVDSAIHQNVLSRAGIPNLRPLLSHHQRALLSVVDARAESGLESLARVRLAPIVRNLQVQAPIAGIAASGGVGRVDLLLDGWLAVELDGDEWHDPVRDRHRDATIVRQGYRSQRFGYEQVISEWADTESTVIELLRYPPPRRPM